MAAKTKAPRVEYPSDGKFRDLVERFGRVAVAERTHFTKARMLLAFDKAKADAGKLEYPTE